MKGEKDLGYIIVPCQVSGDYLKVSKISHDITGSELIAITPEQSRSNSAQSEALCTMFVKREDIQRALENAEPLG